MNIFFSKSKVDYILKWQYTQDEFILYHRRTNDMMLSTANMRTLYHMMQDRQYDVVVIDNVQYAKFQL